MKKILVVSDSHGKWQRVVDVVKKEQPDMMIHLGDGWMDVAHVREEFPQLCMEQVPGNCDYVQEPQVRVLIIEGKQVMICHGHMYRVKMGPLAIEMAAREKQVDLVMFGHTHQVFYDWHNGVRMFNPGSIGAPGFGVPASYGILTIDGDKDFIETNTVYINE